MSELFYSPHWYRVAALKPSLRQHVRIHQHDYRGQLWYVLADSHRNQYHRFTPSAHEFIGLMDGQRNVETIWQHLNRSLGDDAPSQDQVVQLLGQLYQADLLHCEIAPDTLEIMERSATIQRQQLKQRLGSPLAIKLPLWNPELWLNRTIGLVRPVFSRLGLMLWSLLMLLGIVLTITHWTALTESNLDNILAAKNLVLMALIFPCMKIVHELGHAYAVKVRGGEVHEIGIMFIALIPVPYVDASASSAFSNKYHRILVGAAGMMVETVLAVLALVIWLNVEPGIIRSIAFNVLLIGSITTVFFNANPLLRLDGYYILSDAIEIQNLGKRANGYLAYLVQRYLFAVPDAISPVNAEGEAVWFGFYSVASYIYRLIVVATLVFLIIEKYFLLGIAIAIWAVVIQLLLPIWKGCKFVFSHPSLQAKRPRAIYVTSFLTLTFIGLFVGCPLPYNTVSEGILWLPEKALVRTATEGFIKQVVAQADQTVSQGDALFVLEDPLLEGQVKLYRQHILEVEAEYKAARQTNLVKADMLKKELEKAQADFDHAEQRQNDLWVKAASQGRFVISQPQDQPGRFVKQGEIIAYIINGIERKVRVVVSQDNIELVRHQTKKVEVRLVSDRNIIMSAKVLREVPAGTQYLPNKSLGTAGGGTIVVDPSDDKGVKTLSNYFQFDLAIPSSVNINTFGARMLVRFNHGSETLFNRSYRALRQLFLRRLSI